MARKLIMVIEISKIILYPLLMIMNGNNYKEERLHTKIVKIKNGFNVVQPVSQKSTYMIILFTSLRKVFNKVLLCNTKELLRESLLTFVQFFVFIRKEIGL